MHVNTAGVLIIVAALVATAVATRSPRWAMTKADDGVYVLDRVTGTVRYCDYQECEVVKNKATEQEVAPQLPTKPTSELKYGPQTAPYPILTTVPLAPSSDPWDEFRKAE